MRNNIISSQNYIFSPLILICFVANGRLHKRNSEYPAGIEITPNLQDALGQSSKYDRLK